MLGTHGRACTTTTAQGEGIQQTEVTLSCSASSEQRARVLFKQMDPCCLAPDLPAFDAITMVGLLVRVGYAGVVALPVFLVCLCYVCLPCLSPRWC